eukprot:29903-Pelagococcus_subviridis.AAC.4
MSSLASSPGVAPPAPALLYSAVSGYNTPFGATHSWRMSTRGSPPSTRSASGSTFSSLAAALTDVGVSGERARTPTPPRAASSVGVAKPPWNGDDGSTSDEPPRRFGVSTDATTGDANRTCVPAPVFDFDTRRMFDPGRTSSSSSSSSPPAAAAGGLASTTNGTRTGGDGRDGTGAFRAGEERVSARTGDAGGVLFFFFFAAAGGGGGAVGAVSFFFFAASAASSSARYENSSSVSLRSWSASRR